MYKSSANTVVNTQKYLYWYVGYAVCIVCLVLLNLFASAKHVQKGQLVSAYEKERAALNRQLQELSTSSDSNLSLAETKQIALQAGYQPVTQTLTVNVPRSQTVAINVE